MPSSPFHRVRLSDLAAVVLVGLIAQLVFGARWIDSLTSLAIIAFLMKEDFEAWRGEARK